MVNQAAGYTAGGAVPGILGNRHPSIAPYQLFPTADRPVVVAVGNDRQFADFCAALGIPETRHRPPLRAPTPPGSPTSTPSTRPSPRR